MRAGVALSHQADISHIGRSKVTTGVYVNKMIAFLVSATANVMHLHYALVHHDNSLLGVNAYGAHVAAEGTSLRQHFGLSHLYLSNAHGVHNLDFVNLMVTAHEAQDKALFALEGHCLHGFFHRQIQIFAYIINSFAVRSEHLFYRLSFFSFGFD